MTTIASSFFPEAAKQQFHEAKPTEIVAAERDNQFDIVRIVSKYIFFYSKEIEIVRNANFLDG